MLSLFPVHNATELTQDIAVVFFFPFFFFSFQENVCLVNSFVGNVCSALNKCFLSNQSNRFPWVVLLGFGFWKGFFSLSQIFFFIITGTVREVVTDLPITGKNTKIIKGINQHSQYH